MKVRFIVLFALVALLISASAVFAQDQTIVEIASGNEDFSTLVSLVEAAGLADTLNGEGPFTVFAPTNEAFAALNPVVVDYLLAHPDVLTQVLTYHVVDGAVMSADITENMMAASMDMGNELNVTVSDMGVMVDQAHVVTADIAASNGVIHAIDAVLLPPFELPEVDALAVSGDIIAAGSSTVFPVTRRMADLFNEEGFAGTITVDSIGSGAGFERFCANAETDISNASRPIKQEEIDLCAGNGRTPVPFYIGIDALAVVVGSDNDFADALTIEQLAQIFAGGVTWADINPEWPAEPIQLYAPGSDSGTYDYFVEAVFENDETAIQNSGAQFSEDDNVLVQGVEGSPYAIGFFGFAYYQENKEALRAVAIEGVEPNEQTGTTGEYPLSRPLFIYTFPNIVEEKPQVASFVNFYLANANAQLGTGADQIGYIPTNEYIGRLNALSLAAISASMMEGM